MTHTHRLTLACLALLATLGAAHAEELTGTLKKIKDTGVISLGNRESSIPFSYYDDQQHVIGYSYDIMMKIVDAIKTKLNMPNLQTKLIPINSQNRIALVQNGTIDIECGSTTNNLEREKQAGFSDSIFVYGIRMITRKNSGIHDFPDLKGKSVVTTAGTTDERLLRKLNEEKKMGMNIISAKDHGEAFLAVQQGRGVAFVMDEPLLYGERAKAGAKADDWAVVGTPLQVENYACMFRKDDPAFKKVADDTISHMMTSGEMTKLYTKWFMQPVPPRGLNLNYPMSAEMKELYAHPNDKAFQ